MDHKTVFYSRICVKANASQIWEALFIILQEDDVKQNNIKKKPSSKYPYTVGY